MQINGNVLKLSESDYDQLLRILNNLSMAQHFATWDDANDGRPVTVRLVGLTAPLNKGEQGTLNILTTREEQHDDGMYAVIPTLWTGRFIRGETHNHQLYRNVFYRSQ